MTGFTRSLAILIGIDAYANGIPRLTTAVNDAARLAGLLADAHGYETVLLTQPATGQSVTRERLRAFFAAELPARLGEDDRLLVYFAGHGVALDGDDGPAGYLVPQDACPGDSASMLAMTDLHAWLTALPCRHMLAILDCCFAGAFRWAATRHMGTLPDVIHRERYDRYLLSPAWQVLTSAAYDQRALDVLAGDAKRGARAGDDGLHSPFALALIDALERGEADLVPKGRGDGVITATELYLYLRQQVEVQAEERARHEQTPGLWLLNKHDKGEFIFLAPGHPLNLPPAPDLTKESNPYRGLESYDQEHAPLFFGREDEIGELVQRVGRQPFLAVLGASGTGKSSLVKAGVLPRLGPNPPAPFPAREGGEPLPSPRRGGAGGEVTYHVLAPMRPTDRPVRALEALLHAGLGEDVPELSNPTGLSAVIARWAAAHPGRRLVLTIDQFEELATLCRDDAERAHFLHLLAEAVQAQPDAFRLVITLRTDFEPQFTQRDSPLAGLWQVGRYVVPPMDIEDLRQVIEGPASVRVLYFDPPELVDDLIKEVIQTPGALPLLSFTLSELYVKYVQSGRDDRALSGVDYQALGGVVGSLRHRATEEYAALPDDAHRITMQRVMLRMVAVEGGELARRRVALSELDYPTAAENARVQAVLDRLVAARLLVRGTSDPATPLRSAQDAGGAAGRTSSGTQGAAYVEPAHDALVLAWDKLLRWKQEAEDYLPLQRRLAQAAGEWREAAPEAKAGLLWDDDPRLPQVEETLWPAGRKQKGLAGRRRWAKRMLAPNTDAPADTQWLNGPELRFSQASVRARTAVWRRTITLTLTIAAVLTAITIFALIQRSVARVNEVEAGRQRATAEANAQEADRQRGTAVANGEEAERQRGTAVANGAEAERQRATAVAERNIADSRRLALESGVALESNQPRSLLLAVEAQRISSETGLYMRSAQQALLDALAAPGGIALQGGPQRTPMALYSPDGQWIAAGDADGAVYLWDAFQPEQQPVFLGSHGSAVQWAAFAGDSTWLVTADKASARAWPVARPGQEAVTLYELPAADRAKNMEITSFAVSPDGRRAAAGLSDGSALAWSVAPFDRKWSLPLDGYSYPTTVLAFSADGRLLLANRGPYAAIHDLEHLETSPIRLPPHQDWVMSAAFSPAGKALVTTDRMGRVFLWPGEALFDSDTNRLKRGKIAATLLREPSPQAGMARNAAFDPEGHWVAVSTTDGTIHLWNLQAVSLGAVLAGAAGNSIEEAQYPSIELIGHRSPLSGIAFSPDSYTLASAGTDGSVRLWDIEDLVSARLDLRMTQETVKLGDVSAVEATVLRGQTGQATSAAFEPTGSLLLTADSAGPPRLWILSHLNALPVEIAKLSPPTVMVPCGQDRWVVRDWTDSGPTEVRIVQRSGITLTVVSGPPATTNYLTCASTGQWMAASDVAGTIHLWSASAAGWDAHDLPVSGAVKALAFSADARWLAAAGDDSTVRFWELADLAQPPQVLESPQQRLATLAFSPDGRWLATGGDMPGADEVLGAGFRLWDIAGLPTGIGSPTLPAGQLESMDRLVFSSDGRTLQTLDFASSTQWLLWEAGSPPVQLASLTAQRVFAGAGGSWWAALARDNVLNLWSVDPRTGHAGATPLALRLDEAVAVYALSPDGRQIAVGTRSGQVYVWDLQRSTEPLVLRGLSTRSTSITHLFFAPQGQLLVAGEDGTIALWPLAEKELTAFACRYAGRNFTQPEWQAAFPGVSDQRPTCPDWP